jgi:DNA invertase Pin-like site-specific DNA recombinase
VLASLSKFHGAARRIGSAEGRKRAKAAGVKFGRRPKLTPEQAKEARRRHKAGESLRAIGEDFGVEHTTVGRAIKALD